MTENWDIYDINRRKTGRICTRAIDKLKQGEYHITITALILNSKNQILISKRSKTKEKYPLMWECTRGSVLSGETSLQGAIREIKEELGLTFLEKEAVILKQNIIYKHKIRDFWGFKKDIQIHKLNFADGEVSEAKWVTIEEFIDMKNKKEIVPVLGIEKEDYEKAIQIL